MIDRVLSDVKSASGDLEKDQMDRPFMMHDFGSTREKACGVLGVELFQSGMTVVSEITHTRKKYHWAMQVIYNGRDLQLQPPQTLHDLRQSQITGAKAEVCEERSGCN